MFIVINLVIFSIHLNRMIVWLITQKALQARFDMILIPSLTEVASIHGDMPQKERDAIMQQCLGVISTQVLLVVF